MIYLIVSKLQMNKSLRNGLKPYLQALELFSQFCIVRIQKTLKPLNSKQAIIS